MLKKLIIKNFKSFKNETTIDFTKTNYTFLSDINVADIGILKGALFVGANASGKSNMILAIRLLLDLLFKENEINAALLLCVISDENEMIESEFSLDYYFLINDQEIRYLIKNDVDEKVICEKLFVDGKLKLERMGLTAKSYIDEKKEINYSKGDLDEETLSLRKIYFDSNRFAGNVTLRKWYDFLKNSIYFNAFDKTIVSYSNIDYKLSSYLKEYGVQDLNRFFNEHNFDQTLEYTNEVQGISMTQFINKGDEKALLFNRKGLAIPISFNEESLGNQTLLSILPAFLQVAQNDGMLLVDEFSSGFHNVLEELLIKFFMKTSKRSQLIFISHSTNLLTTALLRPDQIYAVEFDGVNGSNINRFSEEQPRVAQNLEKMYLSGIFGGLPNYEDIDETK
jgi:AAA15 family ATPase/GTPase